MYHEIGEYPHDYEDVPDVAALLDEMYWYVLCVYDACRWDAFEEVCESSEPVCSPGSNTPKWTSRVWCNDEYDWSDVTYITGNPHTTAARKGPETGKSWSGRIEEHVGEYVKAYDDDNVWGKQDKTAKPEQLTELALEYEPPIVIHYLQPHEPFVGDIRCTFNLPAKGEHREDYINNVDERFADYPTLQWMDLEIELPSIYYLVITGLVDPEYVRLAYLLNLERAWHASRDIRHKFDTVITTADHGERLGADVDDIPDSAEEDDPDEWAPGQKPQEWGHDEDSSQGRVIPFHINNNSVELPDPQTVGATASHEWVLDR